jgi:hypothetical protein
MDLLRVQALGEGGEGGHVGEEDGDDLALPFQGRAGGEDLVGQVLGGVGGGAGGVEGRRLGQLMAAISTELLPRRDEGTTRRALQLHRSTAILAELHSFPVHGLALGTFHPLSPQKEGENAISEKIVP